MCVGYSVAKVDSAGKLLYAVDTIRLEDLCVQGRDVSDAKISRSADADARANIYA